MIEAKSIVKSFDDVHVLRDVNLKVEQSKIAAIVGKSGAGKSTLLHILGTLDKPDSGMIKIGDIDVSDLKGKDLAQVRNQMIGFVFQFHHLLKEFSALENVMIPGLINNGDRARIKAKSKELLDYLGLADRLEHKPTTLSGGEQQRVAIARALINNPRIVFADEPTGNLDSNTSQEMHDLFSKLQKDMGQTFIIVTHNEELANLSDIKFTLIDGVIHTKNKIDQNP